jgi:predicted RNase H-like nuclease
MSAILGIDAAWTPHRPSGVALIRQIGSGEWECVAVDHSYEDFLNNAFDTNAKESFDRVPVSQVLEAAKHLAKTEVELVVADIPLSSKPIHCPRCADKQVSKLFGGMGCSTHAPSSTRPGKVSEQIRDDFQQCGFSLATSKRNRMRHSLIEAYPHPALLSLMNVRYRVPYKVCKTTKYSPNTPREKRLKEAAQKLEEIRTRLATVIGNVGRFVPERPVSFSSLKSAEDKLDALICAWVGIRVLEGRAIAVGDDEAAIWLPADSVLSDRSSGWSAYLNSGAIASPEFMSNVEKLPAEERLF